MQPQILENVVDIHRLQLDVRDRGQVGVDRNEIVGARELYAVACVVKKGDTGAVGGAVEAFQELLGVDPFEIGSEIDLEANSVQRIPHRARVIDRIVELRQRHIIRVAEDECDTSIQCKRKIRRLQNEGDRNQSKQQP